MAALPQRVFVGFGFGAIQGGLFLYEAYRSGKFGRLVVAEVLPEVVAAVRSAGGRYAVNIATRSGIVTEWVQTVEIFNPHVQEDRQRLIAAVAEATELATALPSVDFYNRNGDSVAAILAAGFSRKLQQHVDRLCVLYAGENHNHAAEILDAAVRRRMGASELARLSGLYQPLNTVIGKMSKVVVDPVEIAAQHLQPLVSGINRALLVEEFNRILISRITLPGFSRGITVFEEKPDLLPFEEAKLYGHNAVHALIGYLARRAGYRYMSEAAQDRALMELARAAFLEESGAALIHRHKGVDALFTVEGYRAYAEDLLQRMVNPWLRDSVERVTRDPRRKLGWDDRLIGTMRLVLEAGIEPRRFAQGAAAALQLLVAEQREQSPESVLDELLAAAPPADPHKETIRRLILAAL